MKKAVFCYIQPTNRKSGQERYAHVNIFIKMAANLRWPPKSAIKKYTLTSLLHVPFCVNVS